MKKVFIIILITIIFVAGIFFLTTTKNPVNTDMELNKIDKNQTTSTIDTTADPATTMSKHTNVALGFSVEYPSDWNLDQPGDYAVKIYRKMKKPAVTETNQILIQVIPTKVKISDSLIYDYNPDTVNKLINNRSQNIVTSDNKDLSDYFTYEQKPGMVVDGNESKLYVNLKPWEKPDGTTEYKHIFSMENKMLIVTAFLGTDTADQFYISEENYRRIINTLKFLDKDKFSDLGTISGKLCYPSEMLPEGIIEAKNIKNNSSFEVAYPGSGNGGKSNYEITVLPGEYIVRYKTANSDGYHTDVCPTGMETTCAATNSRKHITATVSKNSTVSNIDLCDFYYGVDTKPKF